MTTTEQTPFKRIHTLVEVQVGGKWEPCDREIFPHQSIYMTPEQIAHFIDTGEAEKLSAWPLGCQPYAVYAFLGNVDNDYGFASGFADRGVPSDGSKTLTDIIADEFATTGFGYSWSLISELQAYDYERQAPNKPGKTIRELMGPRYFADVAAASKVADPATVRIVFWFDEV